jgi:hypothetical protein
MNQEWRMIPWDEGAEVWLEVNDKRLSRPRYPALGWMESLGKSWPLTMRKVPGWREIYAGSSEKGRRQGWVILSCEEPWI